MEHWKKDLICPVCGNGFKGTAKATMCSSTCRTRLYRMLGAGQKPQYLVQAQLNKQKLPKIEGKLKVDPQAAIRELEAKMKHNERINRLIEEEKKKPMPPGTFFRQWNLQKQIAISELENQIIK